MFFWNFLFRVICRVFYVKKTWKNGTFKCSTKIKRLKNKLIIFIENNCLTYGFQLLKMWFKSNQEFQKFCGKWQRKIIFRTCILKDRSFHHFPENEENDFFEDFLSMKGSCKAFFLEKSTFKG